MNDPIALEEKYHDPNTITSVAVIEWELKFLDMLMQKYKSSPDEFSFFEMSKDSLNFTKESIEGNIAAGVTSPESYVADIKQFLELSRRNYQDALSTLGESNEHTMRLNKRCRLLEGEIQEI